MADEWKRVRVSDVCELIVDCVNKTAPVVAHDTPYRMIRTSNIKKGQLDLTVAKFATAETFRIWTRRAIPQRGDVLLTREAPLGEVAILRDETNVFLGQRIMQYRADRSVLDPQYLFYSFMGSELQSQIHSHGGSGSTVDHIRVPACSSFMLSLPPLAEQNAIARILGTLDAKIAVNQRMNETLEAMARALFKSWFVDFDPVRDKTEGRDPNLPQPLAALFPSRLVDSALGAIPEGWEAGSLGSFVSQRTERVGARDVVILSAIACGKLVRSDDHFSKQVYSKETAKYLLVEQWDFAYNPSRINIGSIGMLEDDILGGVSPVYVVVRPRPAYRWFLDFFLSTPQTKRWINNFASGSVRQSLSWRDFASIPAVLPPEQLVEEYNRTWSVLRDGIRARAGESKTLAEVRDLLLHKLISGELRLKDAEVFLERTAT